MERSLLPPLSLSLPLPRPSLFPSAQRPLPFRSPCPLASRPLCRTIPPTKASLGLSLAPVVPVPPAAPSQTSPQLPSLTAHPLLSRRLLLLHSPLPRSATEPSLLPPLSASVPLPRPSPFPSAQPRPLSR